MDYWNAFWVGGLICALVQILLDRTKLLPGRIMVLLVCSGAFLSFLGLYQPLVDYAGAGASVPLLGFGNILWEGMRQSIEEQGVLGLFTGGFSGLRGGCLSRFDLFLSGKSRFPTENEKMREWEAAGLPLLRACLRRGIFGNRLSGQRKKLYIFIS